MATPHPQPAAVLKAKGSWLAKERAKTEPQGERGVGPCPDWLKPSAKEMYAEMAEQLDTMGVLAVIDRGQLALYAQAYSKWREAEEILEHIDSVQTLGPKPTIHAQARLAMMLADQVAKFGTQFGLTPCSRAGLRKEFEERKSKKPGQSKDPDRFFKKDNKK